MGTTFSSSSVIAFSKKTERIVRGQDGTGSYKGGTGGENVAYQVV